MTRSGSLAARRIAATAARADLPAEEVTRAGDK
jgi:hypothetical protein